MFKIEMRKDGTVSTRAYEGPEHAARDEAAEWCRGWETRTQVSVLGEDGSPVFVAANNDRDRGNASAAGVPSRLVK